MFSGKKSMEDTYKAGYDRNSEMTFLIIVPSQKN